MLGVRQKRRVLWAKGFLPFPSHCVKESANLNLMPVRLLLRLIYQKRGVAITGC